jgi:hypothetical protein
MTLELKRANKSGIKRTHKTHQQRRRQQLSEGSSKDRSGEVVNTVRINKRRIGEALRERKRSTNLARGPSAYDASSFGLKPVGVQIKTFNLQTRSESSCRSSTSFLLENHTGRPRSPVPLIRHILPLNLTLSFSTCDLKMLLKLSR